MSDIVNRLRDRAYSGKVPDSLSEEAADEIADLRFALRQATDRASLAEVKCSQLLEAGRLTDAEREAVKYAEGMTSNCDVAATLRGLLERLGGHQ
jgi:hypothetical protein